MFRRACDEKQAKHDSFDIIRYMQYLYTKQSYQQYWIEWKTAQTLRISWILPQSRLEEARDDIDAEQKSPSRDDKFLMISGAFLLSINGGNDDIGEALRVVESVETDTDMLDTLRTYIYYLGIPIYALCLVKCGRVRDAINILKECTLDLPSVHRQRAIAYQMVCDYGLAYDSWKKSGDKLMECQCLFLIGKNCKVLNIMKKLERDGNVTPLLYELMAQIHEIQGDRKLANRYEMASRKLHRELENESVQ